MKNILILIIVILLIPFLIVFFENGYSSKEIKLNYIHNLNIRVKRNATGVIDQIPLEEYVVGVLAGEMPIYFSEEALKAQAVASRSYALKRIEYSKDNEYDVVDTVMNQVYLDDMYLKEVWGTSYVTNINKLRKVVNETMDEYLDYDGEVIDALFFSTSNGYTEDSEYVFSFSVPYLKSVKSFWDSETSAAFSTSYTLSLANFYEKLGLNYSDSLNFEVLKRSATNRIMLLKINGTEFKGTDVYNRLGLRSTDFNLTQVGSNVVIDMKGYGHGVGMSQYGAEGMAKEGYKYKDILMYYYTGTSLKKIQN